MMKLKKPIARLSKKEQALGGATCAKKAKSKKVVTKKRARK